MARKRRRVSRSKAPSAAEAAPAAVWQGEPIRQQRGKLYYAGVEWNDTVYSIGDAVLLRVTGRSKKSAYKGYWIARIEHLWEDRYSEKWFAGRWFYLPEETVQGRQPQQPSKEVLATNHIDENTVDTLCGKVEILTAEEYASRGYSMEAGAELPDEQVEEEKGVDGEAFFARTFYDTSTKMQRPLFSLALEDDNSATVPEAAHIADTKAASEEKEKKADSPQKHFDNLQEAMAHLELFAMPESLPGREQERKHIHKYLQRAIKHGGKERPLYLAGLPGTGKTATVTQVVNALQQQADKGKLPDFKVVLVNAMNLNHPNEIYSILWEHIAGEHRAPKVAQERLHRRFSTAASDRTCTLLVVDELDYLKTKTQSVLYNLFDWPTQRFARLVIVGISNTMDLQENLFSKVKSRSGFARLGFHPYNVRQIQAIIADRLKALDAFEGVAVEMAARKVALSSGDIRRALRICSLAAELVRKRALAPDSGAQLVTPAPPATPYFEKNGKPLRVTIADIQKAAKLTNEKPVIEAIAAAGPWERCMLLALSFLVQAAGRREVNMRRASERFTTLCTQVFGDRPTFDEAWGVLLPLSSSGLVEFVPQKEERYPLVRLQVTPADVTVGLKDDEKLSKYSLEE